MGHGVQRGGNTFILDVEALRLAPNPAPVVDGRPSRRSDMLWALLQKRCFGRRVRTLPIAAYQDRSRVRPGSLDLERIVDDIRGYAMYSALDDTSEVRAADGSDVRVTEAVIRLFAARTAKYLDERLAAFSLSFHRIRGLARMVADLVDGDFWWLVLRQPLPTGSLTVLGSGKEGVALSDGHHVFKVFDYWWKSSDTLEAPELLRSLVGTWRGTRHLYSILDFRRCGHRAVVVYPFEDTEPYAGGCGPGLIGLLEECWRHGIVCRNIDPDNLRVIDGRVRLIDYGSDIRMHSRDDEREFRIMCQRAWMSFRWATNPRLDKVMRKALTDSNIPELDGFERSYEAVLRVTGQYKGMEQARNFILRMGSASERVLDYGCGDGKLAQTLAERGAEVVGYDPDTARAPAGGHLARRNSGAPMTEQKPWQRPPSISSLPALVVHSGKRRCQRSMCRFRTWFHNSRRPGRLPSVYWYSTHGKGDFFGNTATGAA